MKITEHTDTKLITKDSAGCLWLFGLFFVVVSGMFVVGLMGAFTNLHELNELERAVAWIAALAGITAGIWIIYTSPVITVKFDKTDDTVIIIWRGLMKNEKEKYSLKEVKEILLNESKDDEGDLMYSVEIKLLSGKKIGLTKMWLRNKEELQKTIEEIKSFLNKN